MQDERLSEAESAHKKAALHPNVYTKPVSGFGIVGTQGGR